MGSSAQHDEAVLNHGDLFPRRLSLVAGVLAGVLVAGAAMLIGVMHRNFVEVHREQFPILEMASINVRLANTIGLQLSIGVAAPQVALLDELAQNLDSLEYNLKGFRESLGTSARFRALLSKVPSDDFVERSKQLLAALRHGDATSVRKTLASNDYRKRGDDFVGVIGDVTEALSQQRDEELARQLSFIRIISAAFAAVAFVLAWLFARIYRAYRANLELRFEAERHVVLLSHQRQQLIHVLCHDLGNPVASISGLIGFAEKLVGEERAQAFSMIRKSATNAQAIIDLIRKMQALESGKFQLEMGDHAVADLVRESLAILADRIRDKKVEVLIEIEPGLRARVERTSFVNSVVNNVLSNAVKFSRAGGRIEIRAGLVDGGRVELSVRDHGVGMPPALRDSVFSELEATSRQGTDGETGTGFGMPLAKRFVLAYGGEIVVSSSEAEADHGTEVRVTLKAAA